MLARIKRIIFFSIHFREAIAFEPWILIGFLGLQLVVAPRPFNLIVASSSFVTSLVISSVLEAFRQDPFVFRLCRCGKCGQYRVTHDGRVLGMIWRRGLVWKWGVYEDDETEGKADTMGRAAQDLRRFVTTGKST